MATLEQHLLREQLEQDPMLFMRYFFKQRMGTKMLVNDHHVAIMSALQRVLNGEINRLIINISPGYSKTELCTINMMAYGLAINPKAKFLHLSYSHSLALLNSSTSRSIIKSPAFQSMWPIELKDDADSKAMWWTEQGGGVYATSSAGQVTGFRAGHMQEGFTGCFPAGTMVETERGPMAIDDIVKSKMDIKVWSCDVSTGNIELKPVIGWWENPMNEIIEVGLSDGTYFRCTPDHKIYTRRGYVRADSLTPSDLLPSYAPHALELGFRDSVEGLVSEDRSPLFIRKVGHADNTYCLTVRCNNNFILSSCKALVHNCLIIDDPVKPDDAYSEVMRSGVNNRYNETIASRLAIESVPIIVIMQRIHWDDLSGYLLRGGSGEKWHHLNLPVIINNNEPYPAEYTHGIPIEHGLPDGWLWPIKHGPEQEVALKSHRRKFWAQYMQKPIKRDEETALWPERIISKSHDIDTGSDERLVVAIDPAASNTKTSDAHGIVAAAKTSDDKYRVIKDRTRHGSPTDWATTAIDVYNELNADAIVIETNQGGDMCENTLRLSGFTGRIIRVHASKGKVLRAEPVVALYEQGLVKHESGLHYLEEEMMDFDPVSGLAGGKSPNRVDALVWALTELADLDREESAVFRPSGRR